MLFYRGLGRAWEEKYLFIYFTYIEFYNPYTVSLVGIDKFIYFYLFSSIFLSILLAVGVGKTPPGKRWFKFSSGVGEDLGKKYLFIYFTYIKF